MDWQRRYAERHTPWDLFQVSPPLSEFLASGNLASWGVPPRAAVAVPGCGRGHDLRAWAAAGHRATGFDIVPRAVDEARRLLALNRVDGAEVLLRDVLGIGLEFSGRFDVVYDYTCYCALPPHLRRSYGVEMAAILRPRGVLLHLAFPLSGPMASDDRPPYRVRAADVEAALGEEFEPVTEFPAEGSVLQRRGHERWFVWRRV